MGGFGSGRRGYRLVAEDALKLDAYRLQRDGTLSSKGMGMRFGSLVWTNTITGKRYASISYTVNYGQGSIKLHYTKTVYEDKHSVNDLIWLRLQRTNFEGARFLFQCPTCFRRAAKLYLPPGGVYFRCRRCYNLTYRSSNESRKFDILYGAIARNLHSTMPEVRKAMRDYERQLKKVRN